MNILQTALISQLLFLTYQTVKIVKKNAFIYFFPICRGSVANCGSAVKWLQSLGIIQNPMESGDLASKVEDTGEVYFVPA